MTKFSIIQQLFAFLIARKKYWLLPIVAVFMVVGLLLIAAKGSIVAPFIYTLF